MQDRSDMPLGPSLDEDARLTPLTPPPPHGGAATRRRVRGSVIGALLLLAWDAGMNGTFLMSMIACPIWFFVSILKNAIQRPGWRPALIRIAIPAVTLTLVLANDAVQYRIGKANASRIVEACEQFRAVDGRFPETLDELVPRYLPSIPRAKYCLTLGEFVYWNFNGKPMLMWYVVPPFGRRCYDFDTRQWHYID
jgi:hypothetical protein